MVLVVDMSGDNSREPFRGIPMSVSVALVPRMAEMNIHYSGLGEETEMIARSRSDRANSVSGRVGAHCDIFCKQYEFSRVAVELCKMMEEGR